MPRLIHWCTVIAEVDPYKPPELWAPSLHGLVYEDPRFADGDKITTSAIKSFRRVGEGLLQATTKSGTVYDLADAEIDPGYEFAFPDSINRLLKTWANEDGVPEAPKP